MLSPLPGLARPIPGTNSRATRGRLEGAGRQRPRGSSSQCPHHGGAAFRAGPLGGRSPRRQKFLAAAAHAVAVNHAARSLVSQSRRQQVAVAPIIDFHAMEFDAPVSVHRPSFAPVNTHPLRINRHVAHRRSPFTLWTPTLQGNIAEPVTGFLYDL